MKWLTPIRTPIRRPLLTLSVISLAILTTPVIRADVTTGASEGYGLGINVDGGTSATLTYLSSDVELATVISPNTLPSTAVGTAPPAYDSGLDSTVALNTSLASVLGLAVGPMQPPAINANVNLAGVSGTLNGQAVSTVDGLIGSKTSTGLGSVENLSLNLSQLSFSFTTGTFVIPSLLGFTQSANSTLQSTSTVTGDYGSLTPAGSSIVANLSLNVFGGGAVSLSSLLPMGSFSLDGNGNIIANPNTKVTLNAAALLALAPEMTLPAGITALGNTSLTLTLNKQVFGGDNVNLSSIESTALEIDLNLDLDASVLGSIELAVDGGLTIALGYSDAQLTAVPEPNTVALLGLGILGVAWKITRRQNGKRLAKRNERETKGVGPGSVTNRSCSSCRTFQTADGFPPGRLGERRKKI